MSNDKIALRAVCDRVEEKKYAIFVAADGTTSQYSISELGFLPEDGMVVHFTYDADGTLQHAEPDTAETAARKNDLCEKRRKLFAKKQKRGEGTI